MSKLTTITSPSGARFTVAADYAPKFQALIGDLETAGYGINAKASGGYNPRNIRGTNKPSNHAFGRAVDINWDKNALGTKGEIPAELARSIAQKHGMTWGGDWSRPDPMHFEVANAGPVPMGQRSLTAFAGVQKTQPPTTGTPQPMPNMLDVGGQAPVMDQAEVQRRQKLAQVLMQNGQDPGNMRHWSQALGAVLNTGAGVYQGKQAAQGLAQGQQSGNQALAQLLMGGDGQAAMANPYSAPDAMKFQQDQKMLADRTAAAERLQRSKIEAQNADPLRRAQLDKLQAETAALKSKPAMDQQRLEQLQRMGIDPESAEGLSYRANGKLGADAQKMMMQKQRRQQQGPKVAEGLKELLKATTKYDDSAFSNSLGPIQGSDPDGLLAAGPANVARAFGEVANMFSGGNASPNEVRSYVKGGTLALSNAIKPLIRDPNEGVWTDADQAMLNMIVGDLAQAGSKAEYKRRLGDVSNRVKANFGLEFDFDPEAPADAGGAMLPPVEVPQGRSAPVQGAKQAPDGNFYVPDPNRPGKYLRVE